MQGIFQRYLLLYRPLISRLNELLSEYDLSYSLWQVIFFVKNNGPSTLVEISVHFNVEKPTITRTVQRLEVKQLINVKQGKDRREKIISLSEFGEDIYQNCRQKITKLEYEAMQGIPKDEQSTVFEILPKIRENIINLEGDRHE
ncbi:MAG: MarR family transcriptional regulator [Bacillota bacterium]|nr:MarR family transcriptional regulator [Bacillota bacterium]